MDNKNEVKKKSNLMLSIESLETELEELESVFEMPKLHLSNFFNDLRAEIDYAVAKQGSIKTTAELKSKLDENYFKMINLVDQYEQNCQKQLPRNKFSQQVSIDTQKTLDQIRQNIEFLKQQDLKETAENTEYDYSDVIMFIEDNIYDEIFKLEKIMFLNKTMIFLDELTTKVDLHFSKMDYLSSAGKLIFITNEYFSKRGLYSIT